MTAADLLQNVGRQHCMHAKLAFEFHHWQGELFMHHLTVWVQSKLATFHAKLAYEFHYWKGKLFRYECVHSRSYTMLTYAVHVMHHIHDLICDTSLFTIHSYWQI